MIATMRYKIADYLIPEKQCQTTGTISTSIILHLGLMLLLPAYMGARSIEKKGKSDRAGKIALHAILSLVFGTMVILVGLVFLSGSDESVGMLFAYFGTVVYSPVFRAIIEANRSMQVYMANNIEARQLKEQREQARYRQHITKQAQESLKEPPPRVRNLLYLGTKISGDSFDGMNGLHTSPNRHISIEDRLVNQHFFIIGTTGSGKTQTLLRLISEVIQNTDRNIYFLDGKGELEDALLISSMIHKYRQVQVPIFTLGSEVDGAVYDGFVGSKTAIFNRLAYLCNVMEAEANAKHFADRKKLLLQLICGVGTNRIEEPPRSFGECVERLNPEWLRAAYQGNARRIRSIEMLEKQGDVVNLMTQLESLELSFGNTIQPYGFRLDERDYAIFSMKTQTAGVDAKAFTDFFIEDLNNWIASEGRKPREQAGLLIIDEFQAFRNESITTVLSLARSKNLGVILATQSLKALHDDALVERILDNCNTFILLKHNNAERIANIAGTKIAMEKGFQISEAEATGMGTVREQHQFKINPNDVKSLEPGQAFLINSGIACKMNVASIERIEIDRNSVEPRPVVREEVMQEQEAGNIEPSEFEL